MRRKDYFLLYLISTLFFSIMTLFIRVPGSMDAEYYFAGGRQILSGYPGIEPYIWNYLNTPETLPVISFSYWMPLTSVIASAGMFVLGSNSFAAARLFFVLLAGLIPVMSAWLAGQFSSRKGAGWITGSLALFSGMYLPYLTVTDSFTPVLVLGGITFILLSKASGDSTIKPGYFILLGVIAGLQHIARADGVVWLFALIGGAIFILKSKGWKRILLVSSLILSGYLIIAAPWMIRNVVKFNSILPPGSGLVMWSTGYNDLFSYPASALTPARMFESGLWMVTLQRLKAVGLNIESLVAVSGGVVLGPLMLVAIWKLRRLKLIRFMLVMMSIILLTMSIVFPFAGVRGGYFHSNAAFQIILWALVPAGLEIIIELGIRYRRWRHARAWKMFGAALIVTMCFISLFSLLDKVTHGIGDGVPWNLTLSRQEEINKLIIERTNDQNSVAMVNNPPGFFLASGRYSIVNPICIFPDFIELVDKFDVRFIVLEENNSLRIRELSHTKEVSEQFRLIGYLHQSYIYENTHAGN